MVAANFLAADGWPAIPNWLMRLGNALKSDHRVFVFVNQSPPSRGCRKFLSGICRLCCCPRALIIGWIIAFGKRGRAIPDPDFAPGRSRCHRVCRGHSIEPALKDPRELLRVLFWSFFATLVDDIASLMLRQRSFTPIGFAGFHGEQERARCVSFCAFPVFVIGFFDPIGVEVPIDGDGGVGEQVGYCSIVVQVGDRNCRHLEPSDVAGRGSCLSSGVYGRVVLSQ